MCTSVSGSYQSNETLQLKASPLIMELQLDLYHWLYRSLKVRLAHAMLCLQGPYVMDNSPLVCKLGKVDQKSSLNIFLVKCLKGGKKLLIEFIF